MHWDSLSQAQSPRPSWKRTNARHGVKATNWFSAPTCQRNQLNALCQVTNDKYIERVSTNLGAHGLPAWASAQMHHAKLSTVPNKLSTDRKARVDSPVAIYTQGFFLCVVPQLCHPQLRCSFTQQRHDEDTPTHPTGHCNAVTCYFELFTVGVRELLSQSAKGIMRPLG